jgi:hypothetical protein
MKATRITATEKPIVQIRTLGMCAEVEPPTTDLLIRLKRELVVARSTFSPNDAGGVQLHRKPISFYRDMGGWLWVGAGQVPRISKFFEHLGYDVAVEDMNTESALIGPPCVPYIGQEGRRQLAFALFSHARGVVRVPTFHAQRDFLDFVVTMWPNKSFRIVSPTRSQANRLADHLTKVLRQPVAYQTRGYSSSDLRVRVGTLGSVDLRGDIVILLDARQVLGNRMAQALAAYNRAQLYGLIDDRRPMSRYEQIRVESLIGPVIGSLGVRENPFAGVRVVFAKWTGQDRRDQRFGLEWKRTSIWQNADRNSAIIQIARALTSGDVQRLWAFGLLLDKLPNAPLDTRSRKVAIVVESVEHARELSPHLPGWRVVQADSTERRKPEWERFAQTPPPPSPEDHNMIMTQLGFQQSEELDVAAIVRADGTPWPLEYPRFSDSSPSRNKSGLLVVDFDDFQDATAAKATRSRLRDYDQRGWIVDVEGKPAQA